MQVVVDGGAVAGHFGECFGEFESVGNEDIAAELTLCSSSAINACENPLCLFSCAMRDTGNIGYLLARHVEDDAARVDAHHAIGDAFQIACDVARKQHAAIAGRGVIAQLVEQLVASKRVEPCGRLVEDEQISVVRERTGELQLHAHAARERLRLLLRLEPKSLD